MDLGKLLEDSGAVLRGHFLLTSGRHSDIYFEKFRILEQPRVLSALCQAIAEHYRGSSLDFVAGPTTGGIIIAFEVARQMGLPAVYVETENGVKTLRRGKTLAPGSKGLIVDDVLTTGTSLVETRQAIENTGGAVAAYAVLITRSDLVPVGQKAETYLPERFGLPFFSAHQVQAESFAPDDVPDWLAKTPAVKPGTRK